MLSERQDRILKALVEDYVTFARPPGSSAVLERSGLNVSSATVRSELAALEELGFILQLHTSGGRIPTTLGYRYYIQHLLPAEPMAEPDQITIRHQFHQAHSELDEWLRLAAAVLAHRAHNVAVITSPRSERAGFKHMELVATQPRGVLTIVVLNDGSLAQEVVHTDDDLSQDALRSVADVLNAAFRGSNLPGELERRVRSLPDDARPFGSAAVELLRRAQERRMQIYHQGLGEMLSRPEFSGGAPASLASADRLRRVVDFLQQGLIMEDLLSLMATEEGVHVVMGGEAPLVELTDYSMVVGRYGDDSVGSGVLGVLGPSRMEYGTAISLVRYMSELMTDLVFGR